jgi:hypothetical protein
MQWRTQEIPRGGHIRRHKKLTTFFGKLTSVDLFLENGQPDDLIFLLTDPSVPPSVSQSLKWGAICPSTCFLVFFKLSKIIFRQPKGGGHGPLPPPPLGTPLKL